MMCLFCLMWVCLFCLTGLFCFMRQKIHGSTWADQDWIWFNFCGSRLDRIQFHRIRTGSDSTFADQDWTRTEKFHSALISTRSNPCELSTKDEARKSCWIRAQVCCRNGAQPGFRPVAMGFKESGTSNFSASPNFLVPKTFLVFINLNMKKILPH